MKKAIVPLVLLCFVSSGCTGTFALTKKVYNWHRSQSDKWSDEFGFLVCTLLPIYGLSTFADALVFNSIEFWTGTNPVTETSQAGTSTKHVKSGDANATISYNSQDQKLTIASQGVEGAAPVVSFEKADDMVYAKDQQGNVLYITAMKPTGEYTVYNKDLELVKSYSPQEVALMKDKYLR